MKLDEHLAAIYTLPAFPFPDSGVGKDVMQREKAGGVKLACPVYELPRDFEKPDPRGILRICSDLGVQPAEVLFVGDSIVKDIPLAQAVGALDAWAEYGTYVSAEYKERLAVISAASAMRRNLQQADMLKRKPPTVRLSGFDQVLPLALESHGRVSKVA
jgi:phosphoglycolate phosphatase